MFEEFLIVQNQVSIIYFSYKDVNYFDKKSLYSGKSIYITTIRQESSFFSRFIVVPFAFVILLFFVLT